MCCGDNENQRSRGSYARNIKKPSMFLSSLIVKRRDNRRTSKPNMLLDAVLTNAIRNIKSDKTISKLTSLSSIKKFRNPRSKNSSIDDGRRNSVKTNNKTEKDYNDILKDEEKNRDLIEYLSEVDNFFEELKNVKVHGDPRKNFDISNNNCLNLNVNDLLLDDRTRRSKELSNDDLIENFIETGVVL